MVPGRMLHRLAAHICSAKTLERVVEPAIADLQNEFLAVDQMNVFRRVTVLVGGYVAILKVITMCALSVSVATDDDRLAIIRTMAWSLTLTVAVTGLLMLPPLSIAEGRLSSIFRGRADTPGSAAGDSHWTDIRHCFWSWPASRPREELTKLFCSRRSAHRWSAS